MKSNSTGRWMARARSLRKTKAPFRTPTSSGGPTGVVLGDLASELGDALGQLGLADHDPAEGRIEVPEVLDAGVGCAVHAAADPTPGLGGGRPGTGCGDRRLPVDRCSRPADRLTSPPAGHLAGHDVAPGHLQDPLDLGRRRRMVLGPGAGPQPPPHGPAGQGGPGRGQRRCVGGIDLVGQLVEQLDVAASSPAWRARIGTGSRPASSAMSGSRVVADPIAGEGRVGVGRVVDGLRTLELLAQGPGLVAPAARGEDGRPAPCSRIPARPSAPAPAQQVEQHRLGLVVGRVTGQHPRWQDVVAGPPGPRLEVGARRPRRPAGPRRRRRTAARPPPRPPPPRTNPAAGRGRRGWR